jgi:hypothetical protein
MGQTVDKNALAAVQHVYMLVVSTVDADLLHRAMAGLMADGQFGVPGLLRWLPALIRPKMDAPGAPSLPSPTHGSHAIFICF